MGGWRSGITAHGHGVGGRCGAAWRCGDHSRSPAGVTSPGGVAVKALTSHAGTPVRGLTSPGARSRVLAPAAEQIGLFAEPVRLFVCTPSKLGGVRGLPAALPVHLRRPADPAEGAAVGAQLARRQRAHGAADLVRPAAGPAAAGGAGHAAAGHLGPRGLPRRASRSGRRTERALGWLEPLRGRAGARLRAAGVERTVGAKTATLALSGRVDRIDDVGDGRAGHRRLQDRPHRPGPRRRPRLPGAGALRVRRRAAVPAPCRRVELHHLPTGTVAAHEHTEESLARHVRRAEQTAADVMAAETGGGRGRRPGRRASRPRPARSAAGVTSGGPARPVQRARPRAVGGGRAGPQEPAVRPTGDAAVRPARQRLRRGWAVAARIASANSAVTRSTCRRSAEA